MSANREDTSNGYRLNTPRRLDAIAATHASRDEAEPVQVLVPNEVIKAPDDCVTLFQTRHENPAEQCINLLVRVQESNPQTAFAAVRVSKLHSQPTSLLLHQHESYPQPASLTVQVHQLQPEPTSVLARIS